MNDESCPSASHVSAGIVNPIVGQRLALNWRFDELYPIARSVYQQVECEIGTSFFREITAYRVFASAGERALWTRRRQRAEFSKYGGLPMSPGHIGKSVLDPYGGCPVYGAAVLDVALYLKAMQQWLRDRDSYREGWFPVTQATVKVAPIRWDNRDVRCIIYCEGFFGHSNPLLERIPFQVAKGEILTVRVAASPQHLLLGKEIYALPIGNGLLRIGATYERNERDSNPTNEGLETLKTRLGTILSTPFFTEYHEAGVRSMTRRRTPVLGRHPENAQVVVFNGLGSKGVLWAPHFSRHLVDHLEAGIKLDPEVDILTHWKTTHGYGSSGAPPNVRAGG